MKPKIAANLSTLAIVFAAAVTLNFPWEMAQSFLFASMGPVATATWRCFVASLADGAMILAIVAAGWTVFGEATWFVAPRRGRMTFMIVAAIALGVTVEWWGLHTGRWAYQSSMPRVPFTSLGAVPLVQLPILTPVIFAVSVRWLGKSQRPNG